MMKSLALTMCLVLPMAAFAEDVAPVPLAAAVVPAADQPVQSTLVPTDAAPNGATEGTRSCGMYGGCHGGGRGKVKWIVLTGVVGTLVTAAAVGIAVGVAHAQPGNGQVPR